MLASIGAQEEADSLKLRLQQEFSASNSLRNRPYDLAISVGLAQFDGQENPSIEKLMARADRAMYEDKRRKSSRNVIAPVLVRPRLEAVA